MDQVDYSLVVLKRTTEPTSVDVATLTALTALTAYAPVRARSLKLPEVLVPRHDVLVFNAAAMYTYQVIVLGSSTTRAMADCGQAVVLLESTPDVFAVPSNSCRSVLCEPCGAFCERNSWWRRCCREYSPPYVSCLVSLARSSHKMQKCAQPCGVHALSNWCYAHQNETSARRS